MAKKKRILNEGTRTWIDPLDKYGESRIVESILKRNKESFEEMSDYVEEFMYRRNFFEFDCTGQWVTRRHQLCRASNYWIIRLYEVVDC